MQSSTAWRRIWDCCTSKAGEQLRTTDCAFGRCGRSRTVRHWQSAGALNPTQKSSCMLLVQKLLLASHRKWKSCVRKSNQPTSTRASSSDCSRSPINARRPLPSYAQFDSKHQEVLLGAPRSDRSPPTARNQSLHGANRHSGCSTTCATAAHPRLHLPRIPSIMATRGLSHNR